MAQEELALGAFRLDLVQRRLSHEGHPVELKAKAFDILCVLRGGSGCLNTELASISGALRV